MNLNKNLLLIAILALQAACYGGVNTGSSHVDISADGKVDEAELTYVAFCLGISANDEKCASANLDGTGLKIDQNDLDLATQYFESCSNNVSTDLNCDSKVNEEDFSTLSMCQLPEHTSTLEVCQRADYNSDGLVNLADESLYLKDFLVSPVTEFASDMNGDGISNLLADVTFFRSCFGRNDLAEAHPCAKANLDGAEHINITFADFGAFSHSYFMANTPTEQ